MASSPYTMMVQEHLEERNKKERYFVIYLTQQLLSPLFPERSPTAMTVLCVDF